MSGKKSNDKNRPLQISPSLLKEWLQVQREQAEVHQHEIQQSAQESENNFEFSKLALEADERMFSQHHNNQQSTINKMCWFAGIVIFMIVCFMSYLVYSGNPDLVFEILKGLGYIGAGGLGGYGIGYRKAGKTSSE